MSNSCHCQIHTNLRAFTLEVRTQISNDILGSTLCYTYYMLSSPYFLAGLLFLVIGCWNLVRWMGLFDFTVYGYKKLIHHMEATRKNAPAMEPMPSYVDYLKQPKVIPSAGEPLLTAVVLVALSVLTTVVF